MIISIIAALGRNGELGADNRLLWSVRSDLRLFKEQTMGHHLLMGRRTWESIGRPLPGRTSMILSRHSPELPPGTEAFCSLPQAFETARLRGETELFVIGGGEVYRQSINQADRLYLSRIDACAEHADTWFPSFLPHTWQLRQETEYPPEGGGPAWRHEIYHRRALYSPAGKALGTSGEG